MSLLYLKVVFIPSLFSPVRFFQKGRERFRKRDKKISSRRDFAFSSGSGPETFRKSFERIILRRFKRRNERRKNANPPGRPGDRQTEKFRFRWKSDLCDRNRSNFFFLMRTFVLSHSVFDLFSKRSMDPPPASLINTPGCFLHNFYYFVFCLRLIIIIDVSTNHVSVDFFILKKL